MAPGRVHFNHSASVIGYALLFPARHDSFGKAPAPETPLGQTESKCPTCLFCGPLTHEELPTREKANLSADFRHGVLPNAPAGRGRARPTRSDTPPAVPS